MPRAPLLLVLAAALAALGHPVREMTLAVLDRILGTAPDVATERPGLGTPGRAIALEADPLPYLPRTPATRPPGATTGSSPDPGPPVRRAGRLEDGPIQGGLVCTGDAALVRCLTPDLPGDRWHP